MSLKKLTRLDSTSIKLFWADGHEGPVPLAFLRDSCPCAGCQGETVLLHHYAPAPQENPQPGKYFLVAAEPVGNYALKMIWQDGHEQGLYTWEHLRSLCCCDRCVGEKAAQEQDIPL
jgi:DUF971 family protein